MPVRLVPVPVIIRDNSGEGSVGLGKFRIELESLFGGGPGLRVRLCQWPYTVTAEQVVRICKPCIGESISGIDLDRLVIKIKAFFQAVGSYLTPKEPAFQIQL